jgi:hypothetical protein
MGWVKIHTTLELRISGSVVLAITIHPSINSSSLMKASTFLMRPACYIHLRSLEISI